MALVLIALGSNLGDKKDTLERAVTLLPTHGITVDKVSTLIESEPLLAEGALPNSQPSYLNGALVGHTKLSPEETLKALLAIEHALGRVRGSTDIRWGARLIDLDLLAYDNLMVSSPTLTLPHPEMHKRMFVLQPLAEIAPEWVHPGYGKTVSKLLISLSSPSNLQETNTLLEHVEIDGRPPVILFLTGSSGCGKTYLAQALETHLNQEKSAVRYFDRIGVPTVERMISDFGSPEQWQEATTHTWVENLGNIRDKVLVILEGQYHPRFVLEAAQEVGLSEFVLSVVTASQTVWEERLRGPRGQPGLVTDDMRSWAKFLRDETVNRGGSVIDTSDSNLEKNLDEIGGLVNPMLRRRVR